MYWKLEMGKGFVQTAGEPKHVQQMLKISLNICLDFLHRLFKLLVILLPWKSSKMVFVYPMKCVKTIQKN